MIHQTRKASSSDGKFILSRIAAISGSTLTLEDSFDTNLSNYYVQIVVIPAFLNFTLSGEYTYTPAWNNGAGGICAVACSGACNLSDGKAISSTKRAPLLSRISAGLLCPIPIPSIPISIRR